jgi:hypothetical protein
MLGTIQQGQAGRGGTGGVDEDGGRCAHCGTPLPSRAGGGRRRQYCGATCRSAARRARTPPPVLCSVRAGAARCGAAADGCWHDARGAVIAWTCAAHRELAGELARAGLPAGQRLDRWLSAGIAWHPAPPVLTGPGHDRLSVYPGSALRGRRFPGQPDLAWPGHLTPRRQNAATWPACRPLSGPGAGYAHECRGAPTSAHNGTATTGDSDLASAKLLPEHLPRSTHGPFGLTSSAQPAAMSSDGVV